MSTIYDAQQAVCYQGKHPVGEHKSGKPKAANTRFAPTLGMHPAAEAWRRWVVVVEVVVELVWTHVQRQSRVGG